ncbi:MAG: DUF1573 domain-containing protein [Deltaproteobacteria bacterium]|nr:DUF1573 domain-containing protein [Deltaproteobacteria bacterium]
MKIRLKAGLILVGTLFLLSNPAWAKPEQTSAAEKAVGGASGGPKIVITEKVFDFGEVPQGETISHEFKVVNEGNEPLQIKNVKPG